MPTPSIQTLVTDAQQILNLDSISAVRSVVAVALANANTGTPLNPNLTTQQLWNEFYQVVNKPKSDIESIIANQLMKLLYSPPAPGGAGADQQVIFNDGGVLAGDADFKWNKITNLLTILGAASISGDLTVDTTTFKVVSTNDTVGIRTATPGDVLEVVGSGANGLRISRSGLPGQYTTFSAGATGQTIDAAAVIGVITFGIGGSEAMRLSATGLNVANGNVILGTSGKGIDFSATPSGSGTMTSELFNDYEEGTFVPVIVGTTGAGIGTYTSQVGRYTKIGRTVSAQIYLNWTAHTGTGNMLISGLPFSAQNFSDLYNAVSFGWVYNISLTAGNVVTGYVSYNTPFITLEQYPVGGGLSTPVPIDSAGGFIANVTYIV